MAWKIKNWKKFQHFKDRKPPWIKLYRDLLDDMDWFKLQPESAKGLISIWLIASETDGQIPKDKPLAFRLRLSEKQTNHILGDLYEAGFIVELDGSFEIDEGLTPAQQIAKKNGFGSRYITDEIKKQVIIRDKGICTSCGAAERIEFDHIHPVSKGGESVFENIQLLCRPCNRKKRSRTSETSTGTAPETSADGICDKRSPETEREIEKEVEKEKEAIAPKDGALLSVPDDLLPSLPEIKDWLAYKKQKGQGYKPKGLEALWRAFRAIPPEKRRASVEHSMGNNWSGLFEKKDSAAPRDHASALRATMTPSTEKLIKAFKIAKGHGEDPGWNELMTTKCIQPANQLLAYFGGKYEDAVRCIEVVRDELDDKFPSWGWEAVIKKAPEFKRLKEVA